MENVWVQNITMENITTEAIRLNMYYKWGEKPRSKKPGIFRKLQGIDDEFEFFCDDFLEWLRIVVEDERELTY